MAAATFHQALEQAELLARQTLPQVMYERISCAVALVRNGKVLQRDDGHTWDVESSSKPEVTYSINGHGCQCEDAHYRAPQGRCKHVLATLLARKALALMREPCPTSELPSPAADLQYVDSLTNHPPAAAPLPEAPASVNVHLTIAGRQVQLTLRDTDESKLLARLEAVLARFLLEPIQRHGGSQNAREGWCGLHGVQMCQTSKNGKRWWSHKTDQGWCKGR
jgi:hypothetical protein